jgi:hypothetical protein
MNLKPLPLWSVIGTFAVCGPLVVCDRSYAVSPESAIAAKDTDKAEVLTHGPVHEAFAATVNYNPKPGLIVKKAPPAAIEERPPDQKPEGDNVAWIPGYWAWDEETSDFIWISGIWRNLPPDRQWVPGYWNPLGDEYQWVSGYWKDTSETVTDYLPEPPETLERGPSAEASSRDEVWTPGYWDWRDDRYAWTPGYWVAPRTNWVWIPAHYVWTPRGYVFVRGYWDYAVPRRGVLFAPVYFRDDYYRSPGYYYSPTTVISLTLFLEHLFLRPRYSHYYFGDYYSPRYRDFGYYPSYAFYSSRIGYDPIFSYRRWEHRGDRDWLSRRESEFISLRDNEALRPARTFAALQAKADRKGEALALAAPLEQVAKSEKSEMRFRKLNDSQREEIISRRQEIRKFADARKAEETSAKIEGGKREKAERVQLAASPIQGRAASKFSKEEAPPAMPASRGKAETRAAGEATGRSEEAPGRREITPSRKDEAPGAREPDDTGKRSDEAPGRRETPPSRRDEAPGAMDKDTTERGRSTEAPARREVVPSRKEEAPGAREGDTGKRKEEAPARREVTPSRREEAPKAPERVAPEKPRRVEPEQTARPERPAPKPEPRVQPERRVQPEQRVQPERRETPKAEPRTQPERREPQGTKKKAEDEDKKNE